MNNSKVSWISELTELVQKDENCQQCLNHVLQLEPEFEHIRNQLSNNDRETLDLYIAVCEELEHSHIYPAFVLGQKKAHIKNIQP